MPLQNTPTKFGFIHKSFHWIMAALIFCLLCSGFRMIQMPASPDKIWLVMLHKSLGISILILAFGRLAWRLASPRPDPTPTLQHWEESLARIVHFLLYVAFFVMPVSGYVMSSAGQYPVLFFGIPLPDLVPENREIMQIARQVHNTIAPVILFLLFLHFSGAAKHHVLDRDDTLRRMTWDRMGYGTGIAALAVLGALYLVPVGIFATDEIMERQEAPQPAAQQQPAQNEPVSPKPSGWVMDMAASYIKFEATQSGTPFNGEFKNFTAMINFNPETAKGYVSVEVPIADMTAGSSDRDAEAVKPDWFNAASFPSALFTAESFERKEGNQYVAHGTLTIRGVSKAVDLPFTLEPQAETKQVDMRSEITLNRLDFGIGQGPWQSTDIIANTVKISIYVKALYQGP